MNCELFYQGVYLVLIGANCLANILLGGPSSQGYDCSVCNFKHPFDSFLSQNSQYSKTLQSITRNELLEEAEEMDLECNSF